MFDPSSFLKHPLQHSDELILFAVDQLKEATEARPLNLRRLARATPGAAPHRARHKLRMASDMLTTTLRLTATHEVLRMVLFEPDMVQLDSVNATTLAAEALWKGTKGALDPEGYGSGLVMMDETTTTEERINIAAIQVADAYSARDLRHLSAHQYLQAEVMAVELRHWAGRVTYDLGSTEAATIMEQPSASKFGDMMRRHQLNMFTEEEDAARPLECGKCGNHWQHATLDSEGDEGGEDGPVGLTRVCPKCLTWLDPS